ncbi:MAG: CoB--CoM heterodisulfide reductase iron-sulfur subunit B family protein [Magnetococcales bacterium]|nr:CoB--CoM heterodisulfide reductase iron-sulfur subunit B family protein [Magnetococcales bacterium]
MSIQFAYYPGCAAQQVQKEADAAARAVARELGIVLHDMPRSTCCGAVSLRETKPAFSLAVAARILSEAEESGRHLVTICNTCLQTLTQANHRFKNEPELLEKINQVIVQAGVRPYKATINVYHLLWVITDQLDPKTVKAKVVKPLNGLKVAPFYGCHNLRPAEIFDSKAGEEADHLDRLILLLGGRPVAYDGHDKCCGFHVMLSDKVEMRSMVAKNCLNAKDAGAELMITPCTLCDMSMGSFQKPAEQVAGKVIELPEMNFAQLIAVAFGLDESAAGLDRLHVSPHAVLAKQGIR